jgi:hypothetical protein
MYRTRIKSDASHMQINKNHKWFFSWDLKVLSAFIRVHLRPIDV